MARYASGTQVSIEQSVAELRTLLKRYGADGIQTTETLDHARILFRLHGRYYSVGVPMPTEDEDMVRLTPTGQQLARAGRKPAWNHIRTGADLQDSIDREEKRRWRVLVLYLKAQLEAAQEGILSEPEALMPFLAMPDGKTLAQGLLPQLEDAYRTGQMPPLLPAGRER